MLLPQIYARHAMVQTSTIAVGAVMVVETAAAAAMHLGAIRTAVMTVVMATSGAGTEAGTGIEVARTTAETAAAGASGLGTAAAAEAEALTVADDGARLRSYGAWLMCAVGDISEFFFLHLRSLILKKRKRGRDAWVIWPV